MQGSGGGQQVQGGGQQAPGGGQQALGGGQQAQGPFAGEHLLQLLRVGRRETRLGSSGVHLTDEHKTKIEA